LEHEGFAVWTDNRISLCLSLGTSWPRVIQEQLDQSSAVIVLMTTRAYQKRRPALIGWLLLLAIGLIALAGVVGYLAFWHPQGQEIYAPQSKGVKLPTFFPPPATDRVPTPVRLVRAKKPERQSGSHGQY